MDKVLLRVRENLELRNIQKEDAEILFTVTRENYAHLREWLGWLDDDKNVADVEKYISGSLERYAQSE